MSEPDDIDKLLREIDAMTKGAGAAKPVPASSAGQHGEVVAPDEAPRGGRMAWAGTSAIGGFFVGGVAGTALMVLPYVGTLPTALGAAVGAAAAAAVSGPPAWFRRRR